MINVASDSAKSTRHPNSRATLNEKTAGPPWDFTYRVNLPLTSSGRVVSPPVGFEVSSSGVRALDHNLEAACSKMIVVDVAVANAGMKSVFFHLEK